MIDLNSTQRISFEYDLYFGGTVVTCSFVAFGGSYAPSVSICIVTCSSVVAAEMWKRKRDPLRRTQHVGSLPLSLGLEVESGLECWSALCWARL